MKNITYRWPRTWLPALLLLGLAAAPAAGQVRTAELPFGVGEELVFRARAGRFGDMGRGYMRVEGTEEVRGKLAYLLHFEFRGRVGLLRVSDCTRSLLDPQRMASYRFHKRERSPLLSNEEEVEIFPEERRWQGSDGAGRTASDTPLDELSFLYFIRTLRLADGETHSLDRHFDPERNPVVIRVLGREQVVVPAGEFSAILVEMRVRDRRQKGGEGVLRIHLSDDAQRVPLRIQSSMPLAGTTVLSLESRTAGRTSQVLVTH